MLGPRSNPLDYFHCKMPTLLDSAMHTQVKCTLPLHCIYSELYFSLHLQSVLLHSTAAVWGVIQCLALLPGGARVLGKKRQLLPRFRIPLLLLLLLLLLDLVKVHQMITSVLAGN